METAHNDMGVGFESWEDSWLLVNVDGYNNKRKKSKIEASIGTRQNKTSIQQRKKVKKK